MQKIFEKWVVIVMKSVPGPLNGYHEMKHNPAVTCHNQLEFWNQNRFSQSILKNLVLRARVFSKWLTHGGIFNNMLLF